MFQKQDSLLCITGSESCVICNDLAGNSTFISIAECQHVIDREVALS